MIIVVGLRQDASLCLGQVSGCLKSNLRVLSVSSNPLPLNINPPPPYVEYCHSVVYCNIFAYLILAG